MSINPIETGDFDDKFSYLFMLYISTTFPQDVQVSLKQSLQNYWNVLKKWFLGTTRIPICLACSNIPLTPHQRVNGDRHVIILTRHVDT